MAACTCIKFVIIIVVLSPCQSGLLVRPPKYNKAYSAHEKPDYLGQSIPGFHPASTAQRLPNDLVLCKAHLKRQTRLVEIMKKQHSGHKANRRSVDWQDVGGNCPEPVVPENGQVVYTSTKPGSIASIVCEDNYSYHGYNSDATCTASGKWNSNTETIGACYQSSWKQLSGDFKTPVPYDITLGTKFIVKGRCQDKDRFKISYVDTERKMGVLVVDIQMATKSARHYTVVDVITDATTWKTFPFRPKMSFVIVVTVEMDDFKIQVNEEEVGRFPHYKHPLSIIDHVTIVGEVLLEQVDLFYS